MREITPDEVRMGAEYEQVRSESRRIIAELKRHRRVAIGELLSLVFENHETMCSAVEELIRAERVRDRDAIVREIDAFNTVASGAGDLNAVLYVEVSDPAELSPRLEQLAGIERSTYLEVAGSRVPGVPHEISLPDEVAPAFYIGFSLNAEQREAWLGGSRVVAGVEHRAVAASAELDDEQRQALAADLS